MAKTKRIKSEAALAAIPQSREEATEYIAEIGRLQRERERIQTAMNDELAAVKQRYEEQAKPLADEIASLSTGVQTWCEANRSTLTRHGKVKHANLASGEVKWRTRPPKVTLRGKDNIIETFRRLNLHRFIRIKEDVNKDAILAEPEVGGTVPGVSITQGEDFVIVPFETELEEVA